MKWTRFRFHANADDPRPITWPPPGPYWVTGYGDDYATVVAYLPGRRRPTSRALWPEATHIDEQDAPNGPEFTGRFSKPDWWQ
jgi:hypothetical protein